MGSVTCDVVIMWIFSLILSVTFSIPNNHACGILDHCSKAYLRQGRALAMDESTVRVDLSLTFKTQILTIIP